MHSNGRSLLRVVLPTALTLWSATAAAQAVTATLQLPLQAPAVLPVAAPQPVPPPPPVMMVAPPPRPVVFDGPRFRGGIALSGGGEFVSGFSVGLGGLDGRLGVQLNNLVGIYAQPHVSFGTGQMGAASGATGTVALTSVVDFTVAHRFFVGVGGGYGIVNNPAGPVAHVRIGGYPVAAVSDYETRRRGLMLGLDARTYFTPIGTVVQMMFGIGYEAF